MINQFSTPAEIGKQSKGSKRGSVFFFYEYQNYLEHMIKFGESSRPAIERPGLESQRSRKRLFFHRKISNSLKLFNVIVIICDVHIKTLKAIRRSNIN